MNLNWINIQFKNTASSFQDEDDIQNSKLNSNSSQACGFDREE